MAHGRPLLCMQMVGARWAGLTAGEKQHFVEVAAQVRRSSSAAGGPRAAVSAGASRGGGSRAEEGGAGLVRSRSDAEGAGAEERQLRPHRRPRHYGPDFDTSGARRGICCVLHEVRQASVIQIVTGDLGGLHILQHLPGKHTPVTPPAAAACRRRCGGGRRQRRRRRPGRNLLAD